MSKASRNARKNRYNKNRDNKNRYKQEQKRKGLFFLNGTGSLLVWRTDCPFWERVSQVFSLVILTLFPLYIGSKRYSNITVTKFRAFVVLTCAYLVLCAVIAFLYPPRLFAASSAGSLEGRGSGNRTGRKGRGLPLQRPVLPQILLLAYMLWAVVCTIASPYENLWLGQNRYEGLCSLLLYGAVFLLLSFWGEYTDAYFYGLAISGAVLGTIAFAQSFGSTIFYPEGFNYWNSYFLTTVGNQDCVAGYINILTPALLCGFVLLKGAWSWLCFPALFIMPYLGVFTGVDTAKTGYMALFVLLPCLVQSRERFARLLIGLSPVLLGTALAFAYEGEAAKRHFVPGKTSGALLLLAAVCLALGLLLSFWKKEWLWKPSAIRRAGYAVMLVLLLAGFVYLYTYSGSSALLKEASGFMHGNLPDRAGNGRGYIWKISARLIAERPILGSGPGSFYTRYLPYKDGLKKMVDFAHNDFLNIGVCTGLVGMGLYIAFLLSLAVRCARAVDRCPVLLILLAGMAGYLLYSFFVFSIAIVSPLFWVMAGLADKCVRQSAQASGEGLSGSPEAMQ